MVKNSISEQKLTSLEKKKKKNSVLLIECKAGSFNVIMFQFYSQSFFQDFLTRCEVSSHNNALLRGCQERQSLQAHFPIIILTSRNIGSHSKSIHWNRNYGNILLAATALNMKMYTFQLSLLHSVSMLHALGPCARYFIKAMLPSKASDRPSGDVSCIAQGLFVFFFFGLTITEIF
jgi:hypothetical protein